MTPLFSSNRNTPQFDPVVKPSGQKAEVQRHLEGKPPISPNTCTALFDAVVKSSGREAEVQRRLEGMPLASPNSCIATPVSLANDSRQVGEEQENGNGLQLLPPASEVKGRLEDRTPISSIGSRTPPVFFANDSRQVGEEQESDSDLNLQGPMPEVQRRQEKLRKMRDAFQTELTLLGIQLMLAETEGDRQSVLTKIHEHTTMSSSASNRNLKPFRDRHNLSIETDEQALLRLTIETNERAVDQLTKEIDNRYKNWAVLDEEVAPLFLERAWALFHLNRFNEACRDFEFVIEYLPSRAGEAQEGINECFYGR